MERDQPVVLGGDDRVAAADAADHAYRTPRKVVVRADVEQPPDLDLSCATQPSRHARPRPRGAQQNPPGGCHSGAGDGDEERDEGRGRHGCRLWPQRGGADNGAVSGSAVASQYRAAIEQPSVDDKRGRIRSHRNIRRSTCHTTGTHATEVPMSASQRAPARYLPGAARRLLVLITLLPLATGLAIGVASAEPPPAVAHLSAADARRSGVSVALLPHDLPGARLLTFALPAASTGTRLLAAAPDGSSVALAASPFSTDGELTIAAADGAPLRGRLPGGGGAGV